MESLELNFERVKSAWLQSHARPNVCSFDEQTHVFYFDESEDDIESQPLVFVSKMGNQFRVRKEPSNPPCYQVLKTWGKKDAHLTNTCASWEEGDIDTDLIDLIDSQPVGDKNGRETLSMVPPQLHTGKRRFVVFRDWMIPVSFQRNTDTFSLNASEEIGKDIDSPYFCGKPWESREAVLYLTDLYERHHSGETIRGAHDAMLEQAARSERLKENPLFGMF